jgi:hypothetical protein
MVKEIDIENVLKSYLIKSSSYGGSVILDHTIDEIASDILKLFSDAKENEPNELEKIAESSNDDDGWIYCPNCGRVKEGN